MLELQYKMGHTNQVFMSTYRLFSACCALRGTDVFVNM